VTVVSVGGRTEGLGTWHRRGEPNPSSDPLADDEAVGIVVELGGVPTAAAPRVVSDQLWELIEPLLPRKERSRPGGRSRLPDRETLSGVLVVLHTGIAGRHLPQELGSS
jgi:hypothetical protein